MSATQELTTEGNQAQQPNQTNKVPELYEEDVICLASSPEEIGVVTQVGWNFSDEEDEEESEEEKIKLKKDEILVEWTDQSESVQKGSELVLLDRAFLSGDIVAKKEDMGGQSGTVVKIHEYVDLEVQDSEELVKSVPTSLIKHIHPYQPDVYVVKDSWIGQIIECQVDVYVQFPDGTLCVVPKATSDILIPTEFEADEEDEESLILDFYPSMPVRASSRVWKRSKWLKGSYKNQTEGIVVRVEPVEVEVDWITQLDGDDQQLENICVPSSLTLLNYFVDSLWQVSEMAIYTPETKIDQSSTASSSVSMEKAASNNNSIPTNQNDSEPSNKSKTKKKSNNDSAVVHTDMKKCAKIICTHTFVDVIWQDSTMSTNVDAKTLVPVENFLDEDYWPEDFVLEKDAKDSDTDKLGIIKRVNTQERTCQVKWIQKKKRNVVDESGKEKVITEEIITEEELPVFAVQSHPDFNFQIGDVVVLLSKQNSEDQSTQSTNAKYASGSQYAGEITQIKDGKIEVFWANHKLSWVQAEEVFKIEEEEEDEENEEYSDMSEEEYSDEEEPTINFISQGPDGYLVEQKSNWWQESEMDSQNLNLFREMQPQRQPEVESSKNSHPENEQLNNSLSQLSLNNNNNSDATEGKSEQIEDDKSTKQSYASFEVMEELDATHHFQDRETPLDASKFATKMLKEWKTLKSSLPEGIYIRTFENRPDLLKFLILGPSDTPYHNCVFIFDMYIPFSYPDEPPMLHYVSYGTKMNPNLYPDGTVCLSLLGTWSGKGTEVWTPATSNILQVVLSLQGLILGSKYPYFLEAGYDKLKNTIHGDHNAKQYNESAFLAALETIPRILAHPPNVFKSLITHHFKKVANEILEHCKLYLTSSKVEQTQSIEMATFLSSPSLGFQKSLQKLLPKLEDSFSKLK